MTFTASPPGATARGDAAPESEFPPPTRLRRLVRGRPQDPAWIRPALFALLAGTAVLYLWDLSASGWGNTFYAGAVQAGTKSWKAFFFGSSDASNFITVDKPPAALWVMELSGRLFGLNSWSVLAPQALEGVATVAVVFVAVRRWFSAPTALLAGAVTALTPAAVLMFRYNNPDALLVLLLTVAAYATIRAVESGRTGWLVLAGSLVGWGFLTKELQALLVLPALGLVYLVAGPPRLGRRLLQLLAGAAAVVVSAGWWVVAVMAIPAADRPYIGGSQNNSLWNVIFGYNGFGRLTGNEAGSVGGGPIGRGGPGAGGGPGGAAFGGQTGLFRLLQGDMGADIAWLIPAAVVVLVAGLWWSRRSRRTDRSRAGLLLWGGSLLVTGLTFSYGQGIIHPYYTVALAPLVGATLAVGAGMAWARRHTWAGRVVLAVTVAAAATTGYVLLRRTPTWHPELRVLVAVFGAIGVAAILARPLLRGHAWPAVAVSAALAAALIGPTAFAIDTAATAHAGAIPAAGPSGAAGPGFGGGFRGAAGFARRAGATPGGGAFAPGALPPGAQPPGALPPGGFARGGFAPGAGGALGPGFRPGGSSTRASGLPGGRGGASALLNGGTVSKSAAATIAADSSRYRWVAATVGSEQAAAYQLATRQPIMSIGGFNGTDPAPSLAQFEQYVRQHQIHYFIAGGRGGFAGGGGLGGGVSSDASQITNWVETHFASKSVGGATVYDLTSPLTAGA